MIYKIFVYRHKYRLQAFEIVNFDEVLRFCFDYQTIEEVSMKMINIEKSYVLSLNSNNLNSNNLNSNK